MNTEPAQNTEVVADYYENYKETQAEIARIESRKTRNAIWSVAGLLLGSGLLSLLRANSFAPLLLLDVATVPVILFGVGFLAIKQPLAASIIAAVVFVGLIVLQILIAGGLGAVSGLLVKAVIIYFIIAGIQSAVQAEKARKESL